MPEPEPPAPLEPYNEVVLAPTGRASCKHGREKHTIAQGELKVTSFYQKGGHYESSSRALRCVTASVAKAFLAGATERGVSCTIKVEGDAEGVARHMFGQISQNKALDEADVAFRSVVPKSASKKRAREVA